MSSDLSRTLTEASTNALDKAEAEVWTGRRLTRAQLRYMSEAAVAAVLETLAARSHWLKPDNSDGFVTAVEVNEGLRRLAAEARTETT